MATLNVISYHFQSKINSSQISCFQIKKSSFICTSSVKWFRTRKHICISLPYLTQVSTDFCLFCVHVSTNYYLCCAPVRCMLLQICNNVYLVYYLTRAHIHGELVVKRVYTFQGQYKWFETLSAVTRYVFSKEF